MMTLEESKAWHPEIKGWSDDILPFYRRIVSEELLEDAYCVEVGVYHGRSLIFLAQELAGKIGDKGAMRAKVWGVDPCDTIWYGIGCWEPSNGPFLFSHLARLSPDWKDKVLLRIVEKRSEAAFSDFPDGSLDLVFLDGDHRYEGISRDIASWLSKVKPGGFLAGHDYDPLFPDVIRAVDGLQLCPMPIHHEKTVWWVRIPESGK